jgi:DNA-binding helix-hairpin-helix protein with protein kinase domain
MPILFPSGDSLKIVAKPIGIGGEGKVHRVANEGKNNLVAKIYNKYPDRDHQRKLKKMVSMRDPNLLESSAWPDDLLIDSATGEICGFTMQEVVDSEPLHHFYSPSWRKLNQPYSSWENLLQLTSNLAAVFSIAHSKGIVIGDVNPNSVRVRKNGRVVLIDADSFQISSGSEVFRCRVGVPSFTAPELLAVNKPFDSIQREHNHDLFGLSLLIFHVLFMGRHPFAGVFSGAGDTPIESHIKDFRYAYSADSAQRGLSPPPLSISPNSVASKNIVNLFQNDFTQIGAIKGRTKAGEWFDALSLQRKRLNRCRTNHNHVFDSSISACVWCRLETKGVVFFLAQPSSSQTSPSSSVGKALDITDLHPTKIEELARDKVLRLSRHKLVCPIAKSAICPARHSLTDSEKRAILTRSVFRLFTICAVFVSLALAQSSVFWLTVVTLILGFSYTPRRLRAVILGYKSELSQVIADLAADKADASKLLSANNLVDLAASVESSWKTIAELQKKYDQEVSIELVRLREQHVDSFLRSHLISDASIYGIGPGRSSTLASYGIETAADLSSYRLHSISGFGPVLVSALLSWRQDLLKRYTSPPNSVLSRTCKQTLLSKYMPVRRKAGEDIMRSCELYEHRFNDTTKKLESLAESIRANTNLAGAIRSDIRLLRSSAARTFKTRYQFLVF